MSGPEPPETKHCRRQEQQPASEEVTEVAPGVLRLQLPIRFTGLGHVNSYAMIDKRGAAIVDAGMPGRRTWVALKDRLRKAGLRPREVHTVIVTHSHPDHFGTAGHLAHVANAELVTERRFRTWVDSRPAAGASDACDAIGPGDAGDASDAREPDTGYADFYRSTPWGGDPLHRPRGQATLVRAARHNLVPYFRPPTPTRRVSGGDHLVLAGREWRVVHTPGHTRDHLCLYDGETEVLLSGDHVLPTITPHVSGITGAADALADYLASLDSLRRIGRVGKVLPAHGECFADLGARIAEIEAHHAGRLDEIRRIARETGSASVVEFSHRMFRQARWGMMAESETYAHLEHLRLLGEAERYHKDGLLFYDVGGTGAAGKAPARKTNVPAPD